MKHRGHRGTTEEKQNLHGLRDPVGLGTKRYAVLLLFLCGSSVSTFNACAQVLPYQSKSMNLGTVNCANSLCHGSASPWKDSNILQNEYITWSRVDKHATRAYQVLFEERSKRITRNLGIKEAPQDAKLCLDCHTYDPPVAQRGERFKIIDGVSCEACHGPASPWIETHVAPHATHADNVAHGLYPTNEPVAQAKLCLACHFGNKDKFVTHRMMGAGHPRISFELETFVQTQPAHYVIDDDWVKRKGSWDPTRVWAVGQALAASELLDVLADPKRSRDGLFPELVVFDCHACHHPMSDTRWTPRPGSSPGRIRLNNSNLLMLRQIARCVLPGEKANDFAQHVTDLNRAVAGDGGDPMEAVQQMRSTIDAMTPAIAAHAFSGNDLRTMLAGLADDGAKGEYHDYSAAEQATMAIGGLLGFMGRKGEIKDYRAANAALDKLYDTVKDDEKFRPERFRAALEDLRATVNPR
jgi:Cytochrome c554 and c-prime